MCIMKAHFYKADGTAEEHQIDVGALPMDQIKEFVEGDVEFVSVLFNGKPAHMIVNDIGAMIGLPINERATTIYHENIQLQCQDRGMPYHRGNFSFIYGNAVVFEGRLP